MKIAVLALQGAFVEHKQMLLNMGVECFEVRKLSDWQVPKDGLIIPGGESTTMKKLLIELGLFTPIQQAIRNGLSVFGTCAGLIMLSSLGLDTMDIEVVRNAYGRQLGSFRTVAPFHFLKSEERSDRLSQSAQIKDIPMTFIRAPYIAKVQGGAEVLATVENRIVAARQANQLVTAFHPELDADMSVHKYFIDIVQEFKKV